MPPALALLVAAAGACGGPTAQAAPDAGGVPGTDRLVPDGATDLGLAFGQTGTLRVRYLDASGSPRAGMRVDFSLVGEAGGSALASTAARTGPDGTAGAEVRAGHRETFFEVRAAASGLDEVDFAVSVNESGSFASLSVRAAPPPDLDFRGPLTIRLYDNDAAGFGCGTLSADDPPATPRIRTAAIDETVSFTSLLASRAYTVLAAPATGPVDAVVGCVEILPSRLLAGTASLVVVPLRQPAPVLAARYTVATRVPLDDVPEVGRPLGLLGCRNAPGELVLDCLIDAADLSDDEGGVPDCVPADPDRSDGVSQALEARRGPAVDGCRPDLIVTGLTVDAMLHGNLGASLQQTLGRVADPAVIRGALRELRLESLLDIRPTAAPDRFVGRHALASASLGDSTGEMVVVDLAALGLPYRIADGVAIALQPDATVTITPHAFSLRFGALARGALGQLVLEASGLPSDSQALVEMIVADLTEGAPNPCVALDELLCAAVGLGTGCLSIRCSAALAGAPAAIDAALAALDGGADFTLGGSAVPEGAAGAKFLNGGLWNVTIGPAEHARAVAGSFSGGPSPTRLVIDGPAPPGETEP